MFVTVLCRAQLKWAVKGRWRVSAAHFVMTVKDIFVSGSFKSDKMPPRNSNKRHLSASDAGVEILLWGTQTAGKKNMLHEFYRESVAYLNKLYIDGSPDISDGGILWPTGFWEVTLFVTAYLWSLCRSVGGRHWVFYCDEGGQHEAMLLRSPAPFHMI